MPRLPMPQLPVAISARAGGALGLVRCFGRDECGAYLVIATLVMPVLVGLAGLGTEAGLWMYKHRAMQSAADSGAYSAATAYVRGVTNSAGITSQARAVATEHGFRHGANDITVTVNWPYSGDQGKFEVIVEEPQVRLFSSLWERGPAVIRARALAAATPGIPGIEGTLGTAGNGCVLALNRTASGSVQTQGTANVYLDGCSMRVNSNSSTALTVVGNATINAQSVGVVGGISGVNKITTEDNQQFVKTGIMAANDPYAGVPDPIFANGRWSLGERTSERACDLTNYNPSSGTYTIGPTDPTKLFVICQGLTVNAGVILMLRPGIYIFDRGLVQINGQGSVKCPLCVNGAGVTLVFTSSTGSDYARLVINGGATFDLAAPQSGPTKGLVIFGDRSMPTGTEFKFNGGSTQTIDGAIYVPAGNVLFAGGSDTAQACTQLVADTITFTGNSNFKIGCDNGTEAIGSTQGTPGQEGTPETVMLIE